MTTGHLAIVEASPVDAARDLIRTEARAVAALHGRIDDGFLRAVELVATCPGRVVITGLGKSGRVGRKIAATLASTGSPALFVHAAEALHGDAGMVQPGDVLIAISNSGETMEVCEFCELLAERGVPIIAMTAVAGSTLALRSNVRLDVSVEREADPLGLVPTASTTATIAMGDALAIAAMVRKGVGVEEFRRNHPGGSLGRLIDGRAEPHTSTATADVCVVGSFMFDLVASTQRRPSPGETVFGESFGMFLGGKGFNQAIAAARAGVPTAMVGRVGIDDFGDRFRQTLDAEGILADHVRVDDEAGTGVGLPVLDADGTNSIVVVPRANLSVTSADIEAAAAVISSAGVLLIQFELPIDAVETAARVAKEAGTVVILNPAPANANADRLRGLVDILVPNEVEAEQLTEISCDDTGVCRCASTLLESWALRAAVITLGERGCYVATPSGGAWIGPHAVDVVDTVGAGDAFAGALAARLGRGDELLDAVHYANAAGALAVTKAGAEPSMPSAADVSSLLAATSAS